MSADGDSGPATFPYVRRRGPVGIVGISTAIATAPLMATGRIERDQAAVLARHLEDAEGGGTLPGRPHPSSAGARLDQMASAADRRGTFPRCDCRGRRRARSSRSQSSGQRRHGPRARASGSRCRRGLRLASRPRHRHAGELFALSDHREGRRIRLRHDPPRPGHAGRPDHDALRIEVVGSTSAVGDHPVGKLTQA